MKSLEEEYAETWELMQSYFEPNGDVVEVKGEIKDAISIEGVMCTYQREIERLLDKIAELEHENKFLNNECVMWRTKFIAEGAAKCILEEETISPFEAPPKFMEITIND